MGGTQALADAIAGRISDQGGTVATRAEVSRIRIRDGRAVGVELADGRRGERYREVKEETAECLVASVEEIIPGLSEHVVCKDVATPLTYERYTMSSEGATGWLPLPGDKMRSQRTPIRNLFQAGQWTFPGAGVPTVMASGRAAAELVLREAASA